MNHFINREKFLFHKLFFLEVSQVDNKKALEQSTQSEIETLVLYIVQVFLGRIPLEKSSFKKLSKLKSYQLLESSYIDDSLSDKSKQKEILLKSRKALPILLEALW